jgi:cob(I)alamin adenosyltransferase
VHYSWHVTTFKYSNFVHFLLPCSSSSDTAAAAYAARAAARAAEVANQARVGADCQSWKRERKLCYQEYSNTASNTGHLD